MKSRKEEEIVEVDGLRSKIHRTIIEDVEIDNYSETEVSENNELLEYIVEHRELPKRVMPPHVVPAPSAGAKLILIDSKDPFWTLNPEVSRDITCWVEHNEKGETRLIDAVTGKQVGIGVPAPSPRGTAISGYCQGYNDPWKAYRANAATWFGRWGITPWSVYAPSRSSVGGAIGNSDYKYHYALAHGDYNRFQVQSRAWVYASNIAAWLAGGSAGGSSGAGPQKRGGSSGGTGGRRGVSRRGVSRRGSRGGNPLKRPAPGVDKPGFLYAILNTIIAAARSVFGLVPAPAAERPKFAFAFLGQCGAFTKTGPGTMSHAFTKGESKNTVCVGYYNAHTNPAGWRLAYKWQGKLFYHVHQGATWRVAFNRANAAYPACRSMVRFIGDASMKKVPAGGFE